MTHHGGTAAGHRRAKAVVAAATLALSTSLTALAVMAALPAHAAAGTPSAASGLRLDRPDGVALDAGHLFVANAGADTVSVVDPADGHLVATVGGSQSGLAAPGAVAVFGAGVWVADTAGTAVTEISARTDRVVRVVSGKLLIHPIGLAVDGAGDLYVLDAGGRVSEITTGDGHVVATAGAGFGFAHPAAIAYARGYLYVTNASGVGGGTVSVLSTAHGLHLLAILSARSYHFDEPTGITATEGGVWVVNARSDTLTELAAANRALVQVVDNIWPVPGPIAPGDSHVFVASPPGGSPMVTQVTLPRPAKQPWMMCNTNGPYDFSNPQVMLVVGADLWVVNEGGAGGPEGNSLTEMNASTGALLHVYR
jgi:hypothetical protein